MEPPRIAWIGEDDVGNAVLGALGWARFAAPDWRGLRRARVEVVVARGGPALLRTAAWSATLGGALAVIASPTGPVAPLPWWERRFLRYLLRSQAEARAWRAVGVALGRLVVVEPGEGEAEAEALLAICTEAASMGRRPGRVSRTGS